MSRTTRRVATAEIGRRRAGGLGGGNRGYCSVTMAGGGGRGRIDVPSWSGSSTASSGGYPIPARHIFHQAISSNRERASDLDSRATVQ